MFHIHGAVVLDAAMTVRQARERLAQHGYWVDGDPVADAWLEAYAAHIERLSQHARPRRATFTAQDAARLLARRDQDARVVIRREAGLSVYWYALPVWDALWKLHGMDPRAIHDASVARAFVLTSAGTCRVAPLHAVDLTDFHGVLLDGDVVAGVVGAPPSPLQPPRRSMPSPSSPLPAAAPRLDQPRRRSFPPDDYGPTTAKRYPYIMSKEVAVVGVPFEVDFGLTVTPVAGVSRTSPIVLDAEAVTFTARVVADGFDAPVDACEIEVRADQRGHVTLRCLLTARPQEQAERLTTLRVTFSREGVYCGAAARNVVVRRADLPPLRPADLRESNWIASERGDLDLTLQVAPRGPDVELNILKLDGNCANGRYHCTLSNAHGVAVPAEVLAVDLGTDADTFAKGLIDGVRHWSRDPLVDHLLRSAGTAIADKLPAEFWRVLREVAVTLGGRPLFLQVNSAEPYVPWELARVDPPLDPSRPPFLAAQVVMGRWIVGDRTVPVPPRDALPLRRAVVMAGKYSTQSGLRELPEAIEEARQLVSTHQALRAVSLDCSAAHLRALLDAEVMHDRERVGGVELVHFAGHGEVDPTRPHEAALYLDDGKPLSPLFFRKSKLGTEHNPFLFLNACMVGTAGTMLGDCGGFPGNCISGGFTALLAPLWAVHDGSAKTFALAFYERLLRQPSRSVAEILRDLRAEYDPDAPVPTYLAYVYYGNPRLTLSVAPHA